MFPEWGYSVHLILESTHVHDATDSCHACDMYGETSPSEDSWVIGDAVACCMVPLSDAWRVRTLPHLCGRLHMSHAGASRRPRLHRWLSRTNDQ